MAFFAARPMTMGSSPNSCRKTGRRSWERSAIPAVFLSPYWTARELTISVTAQAAPNCMQSLRKAASVTPAIGASAARPSMGIVPIFKISLFLSPACRPLLF